MNSCLLGCWQENGFYSPLWLNKTIFRFSSLSIMVTSLLKGVKSCLNIQTIYFLGYTILATSSHNFANFAQKKWFRMTICKLKMMIIILWNDGKHYMATYLYCLGICKLQMMIINEPYINDYISYWLNFGQMYKV